MRRCRTVEIKTSSATAWTGSMTTLRAFRKSAGKLFHSLVAAAAKVLSPKQLGVRWTEDSVLVSAERSIALLERRWQITIIGKVSRSKTGQGPVDKRRYLEHHALPDQCSWRSTGEIWWDILAPVTNLVGCARRAMHAGPSMWGRGGSD